MVRKGLRNFTASALNAAVITFAPAALAQSSTTNCTTFGNTLNCRTQQQQGVDWGAYNRSIQDSSNRFQETLRLAAEARERRRQQELAESYAKAEAEQRAAKEQLSATVRQSVGAALKDGRCDDAIGEALKYGEIELANQAKAFCAK